MLEKSCKVSGHKHSAETIKLTVIILTFNESRHIERSIRSALRVADDVLVVDSYSTDDTVTRARQLGVRVLQNKWVNYAAQLNWALQNGNLDGDWVMRLDADEFLDDQLVGCVRDRLATAGGEVGGFEVNRRIRFMGQDIRHGGMAPLWMLRFWRNGWARCETRWMDEHMVLTRGHVARLPGVLIDENLNPLTWWTQKHNQYASRETVDLLDCQYRLGEADDEENGLNRQARFKRWLKTQLYARLPLGMRPWLYFFYRMFVRLGILDGGRGMIFHTLQGLWYRLLVDAKVKEIEHCMQEEGCDIRQAVYRVLGIELTPKSSGLPERTEG